MIQRIQSIWLSILAILSLSFVRGGIIRFNTGDGSIFTLGFSGITKDGGGGVEVIAGSIGLPLIIILIPVLAIAAIFLFKNIKLQKTVNLLIIAFSLCLLILTVYYWYIISHKFSGVPVPGIKMVIPPVIFVLAIMSYIGILKDEKLLRSYDRLR
jgi:hypothetical protein